MTETTQEERDRLRRRAEKTGSADLFGCEIQESFRLLNDADRLAQIEPERENALTLIRMRGVPEQRAEGLVQALDVLLTRLDREIQALRGGTKIAEDRLAAIERRVEAMADKLAAGGYIRGQIPVGELRAIIDALGETEHG